MIETHTMAQQSYDAIYIRAIALSDAFFVETEILWHAERSSNSLGTLAALSLFPQLCWENGNTARIIE